MFHEFFLVSRSHAARKRPQVTLESLPFLRDLHSTASGAESSTSNDAWLEFERSTPILLLIARHHSCDKIHSLYIYNQHVCFDLNFTQGIQTRNKWIDTCIV